MVVSIYFGRPLLLLRPLLLPPLLLPLRRDHQLHHPHHHAHPEQEWIAKTNLRVELILNFFAANLEELGDFFEGDMIRLEDLTKNHLNNAAYRWPNGVVPYVNEGTFSE